MAANKLWSVGVNSPVADPPKISVVVPIYNEQDVIPELCERLEQAMQNLGAPFEIVFVDDGSRDNSPQLLRDFYHSTLDDPSIEVRVVLLRVNAGQHGALLAGFTHVSGQCVVTIDADLQNAPEDIGLLYEQYLAGHDYVGSIREQRRDAWWRDFSSRAMNRLRERITDVKMTDQGCMFRLYDKGIIDAVLISDEAHTYIPALGSLYSRNPIEIEVSHYERAAGESKYSLFNLINLNFDLVTGFSLAPLQFFSFLGIGLSALSLVFAVYMVLRRLVVGPEVEGVFTLFAIAFFMLGLLLAAVGVLGEYVGRIYTEVRRRPRYLIEEVLGSSNAGKSASSSARDV